MANLANADFLDWKKSCMYCNE